MKLATTRWTVVLGTIAAFLMLATAQAWAEPLATGDLAEPEAPAADKQIKEVTEAVELFQKMNFSGALDKLKDAVAKHPELPPPRVIMAQLFARARQGGGVRFSLERAVVEDPKDPEAYVLLAEVDLRERRVTEADLLFRQANALMAGFKGDKKRKDLLQPRIYAGLASVAQAREEWATAQKYLEDLLKIDDDNAVAMQRLAQALFKIGKPKECLAELKKAKEANPAVLTPGAQMALLYQQAEGKEASAKQWMEYALKVAPDDLRTRLVAAQWALETNQIDMAKEQTTKAMQLDPQSLEAMILRGVVALFQKEYAGAERYFETAHLQSPGLFAASNNLALALCEQDDDAKKRRALEYAASNARQHGKGRFATEAASTYGWVLYKLGRLTDAEKALRQAASSGNLSADTAYYIAQLSADVDRKDQAIPLLEGALKSKRPFSKRQEAEALLKKIKP